MPFLLNEAYNTLINDEKLNIHQLDNFSGLQLSDVSEEDEAKFIRNYNDNNKVLIINLPIIKLCTV